MKNNKFFLKLFSLLLALLLCAGCAGKGDTQTKKKTPSGSSADSSTDSGQNSSSDVGENIDSVISSGTDITDDTSSYSHPRPWVDGDYSPPAYVPSGSASSENSSNSSNPGGTTSNPDPVKPIHTKAELLDLLNYLTFETDNYAIGVHLFGDLDVNKGIRSFKKRFGKEPAYIDFDMHALEYASERSIETAVTNLTKFAQNGGFVAIADHWLTPLTNYTQHPTNGGANDSRTTLTQKQYREVMTEGTTLNKNFLMELEIKANFLKKLKENGVPVIYRPLHEGNGSWFWWGINKDMGITGSDVADLYRYVYSYYTVTHGLDNILWEFCTAVAGYDKEFCDWYPGNEYVDILATNWYVSNSPNYNEVDDPTVGKFNRFYTDTIKNCGNKPYVIPEYGGDATYTITEHPLKKSLEIVEARIDRGAKVAYVGPYFYYDNDELGSELTPRVITLEQMSGYWSKAKR